MCFFTDNGWAGLCVSPARTGRATTVLRAVSWQTKRASTIQAGPRLTSEVGRVTTAAVAHHRFPGEQAHYNIWLKAHDKRASAMWYRAARSLPSLPSVAYRQLYSLCA
eukprot:TRINITY_DN182_c1_g1_i4.p3 TRINITY_DN182_c1_g1~~TRINITY_DN182_c1_g1_i4.p3  ORF type:complete len:108 (+),score=4.61 TRINITY_DN182_c1_g1_i4:188-511(+)